jgi:hypothetical protein
MIFSGILQLLIACNAVSSGGLVLVKLECAPPTKANDSDLLQQAPYELTNSSRETHQG